MSDMREGLAFLHIESQTDYAVLVGIINELLSTAQSKQVQSTALLFHERLRTTLFVLMLPLRPKGYRGPPNTDNQPLHKMSGDFWMH